MSAAKFRRICTARWQRCWRTYISLPAPGDITLGCPANLPVSNIPADLVIDVVGFPFTFSRCFWPSGSDSGADGRVHREAARFGATADEHGGHVHEAGDMASATAYTGG